MLANNRAHSHPFLRCVGPLYKIVVIIIIIIIIIIVIVIIIIVVKS